MNVDDVAAMVEAVKLFWRRKYGAEMPAEVTVWEAVQAVLETQEDRAE